MMKWQDGATVVFPVRTQVGRGCRARQPSMPPRSHPHISDELRRTPPYKAEELAGTAAVKDKTTSGKDDFKAKSHRPGNDDSKEMCWSQLELAGLAAVPPCVANKEASNLPCPPPPPPAIRTSDVVVRATQRRRPLPFAPGCRQLWPRSTTAWCVSSWMQTVCLISIPPSRHES